jgi:hypothetical protein
MGRCSSDNKKNQLSDKHQPKPADSTVVVIYTTEPIYIGHFSSAFSDLMRRIWRGAEPWLNQPTGRLYE